MTDHRPFYRCGYCGQPTNAHGTPIEVCDTFVWAPEDEVLVTGACCETQVRAEQEYEEYVTREMALDAGDSSLEGTRY